MAAKFLHVQFQVLNFKTKMPALYKLSHFNLWSKPKYFIAVVVTFHLYSPNGSIRGTCLTITPAPISAFLSFLFWRSIKFYLQRQIPNIYVKTMLTTLFKCGLFPCKQRLSASANQSTQQEKSFPLGKNQTGPSMGKSGLVPGLGRQRQAASVSEPQTSQGYAPRPCLKNKARTSITKKIL